MLTSTEQFLQVVAWLLVLLEVSVALYILVLNVRHPANRHISALLLLFAVNGFAVGQLLGARGVESARMPTLHLAAAAPAIAPSQFLTMLMLLKPDWLEGRGTWLKGMLYLVILLPTLLLLSDLLQGTQYFYSGLDPMTYAGGYAPLRDYLQGQFGALIRILYTNVLHSLPFFVLIYVAFWDQKAPQSKRSLAGLLLAMNLVVIAMMFGGRWEAFRVPGILLGQSVLAAGYTYVAFKQMISRRLVKRGHLQSRMMLLFLAVMVPLLVGSVIFIVRDVESFLGQLLVRRNISPEAAAVTLEEFKRTIWLTSMGAFLLVMAFVWLTVQQTLRPIQALTETARAIAEGDLERQAPVRGADEVGTLARAFNVMTRRLHTLINELEDRVTERTQALEQRTKQLESSLAETEALYKVSRSLIAVSDPSLLYQTIVDTAVDALSADRVLLIIFDVQEERVIDVVSNESGRVPVVPPSYEEIQEGLSGWVLREGRPAFSPKGKPDPRESPAVRQRRRERNCGAIIVAPLTYRDRMLGHMTVLNHVEDPDFTERDVELAVALAHQAAAAVHSARLVERLQASLRETKALYRLSRSLIEPQREDALMQRVVDLVAETLTADRVGIVRLDFERRRVLGRAHSGPGVGKIATDVPFTEMMEGLAGWTIRERKPALSPKDYPDPRESPRVRRRRAETECGSILVAPLFYQDEPLGFVTAINRPDQPDFTEHDAELLMTMANQAAAAIQNAYFFRQIQNALAETQALYRITRKLVAGEDLASMLQAVVDGVFKTLSAHCVALITVDHEKERVLDFVGRGKGLEHLAHISYTELMEGLSGWAMRENRPALSRKGVLDPRESPRVQAQRTNMECGSILVVPLRYRGETLGTITAINRPDQPDFSQHDADLMMALAHQAAAAIQNVRLFEQTQAVLARTEALYGVARSLIAIGDLEAKLETVAAQVANSLPADRVLLVTLDLEEGRVLHHITGGTGEKVSRASFKELMGGLTGWVIRERKPALSPGGKPDPRESPAAQRTRAASESGAILVVPMIYQEEVLGTLTAINRPDQRDFASEDADLMLSLANQAAVAIKNARLVENLEAEVVARTAEIRAEQEKSEAILQSVGDAIAMVDLNVRIRYVNRAFLDLTGYRPDEVLNRRATFFMADGLKELRQLWPSLRRALALGNIWQGETALCRADGSTYDATLTVTAMRDGVGQLVGYVTSHQDITRVKQLEKARRDFLVNVSHQLRTPVTTIKLYLHLLQQNPDAGRASRYLRNAVQETASLAHLVEDMLMVTELDSGEALTVWREVSLLEIAEDVISHYLSRIEEKGITLNLDAPDGPPAPVYGDPSQLHRAVAELVENAVNFTPPQGHVTVGVRMIPAREQRWVQLTVTDDGPGITAEEREYLFERFYRGRLAESGHIPGSGLGLVIAQGIVEAHGGELYLLDTDTENGSTFVIRLLAKGAAEV